MLIVFDLDGTLADCTHRLHHIKKSPKDWDAFFAGVKYDKPIRHMVDLSHAILFQNNVQALFCSGRPERTRKDTLEWLAYECSLHVISDELYMRADGDYRPDFEVKQDLLRCMSLDYHRKPDLAFDDRQQVVDMWRRNGIPCAQVAEGDF